MRWELWGALRAQFQTSGSAGHLNSYLLSPNSYLSNAHGPMGVLRNTNKFKEELWAAFLAQ